MLLAFVAGCVSDTPTGDNGVVTSVDEVAMAGTCHWTPDTDVMIPDGNVQAFGPNQLGCNTHIISIPVTAGYGFSQGVGCAVKVDTAGLFKIRSCTNNTGTTVTIKNGTTTVQTISIIPQ